MKNPRCLHNNVRILDFFVCRFGYLRNADLATFSSSIFSSLPDDTKGTEQTGEAVKAIGEGSLPSAFRVKAFSAVARTFTLR